MKTVAVISQKGGVGKTTAAIQIGFAAHQAGLVTVIVTIPRARLRNGEADAKATAPALLAARHRGSL